jgi:polyamine oxidase
MLPVWLSSFALAVPVPTTSVDVIIIGAGMCGVSAAKELNANGITNYLILEAQDVVGGRMKQGKIGGVHVELGANFVEGLGGKMQNPIEPIVRKLNLTTYKVDFEDGPVYRDDGSLLPDKENPQDKFDAAMEAASEQSIIASKKGAADVSIRNLLSSNGWKPTTYVERFSEFLGIEEEYVAVVDDMSSQHLLVRNTFTDFGEVNEFVRDERGYKLVPETILAEANGTNKVVFNSKVVSVEYSGSNVRVTTSTGVYQAKYLISTVSLGVLQHKNIQFKPALPKAKVEAISKFRIGVYFRFWMNFPTKFWEDRTWVFYASKRKKGWYPEFLNGMSVYSQSGVKGNLMLVTLSGPVAAEQEKLSDQQVISNTLQVLRKIYGDKVVEPTEWTTNRWGTDPNFYGSYTYWPIGFTDKNHEDLRANVDGRVFFSGEMTSKYYYGYVHGAHLAGIDAAKSVSTCFKSPNSCKVDLKS